MQIACHTEPQTATSARCVHMADGLYRWRLVAIVLPAALRPLRGRQCSSRCPTTPAIMIARPALQRPSRHHLCRPPRRLRRPRPCRRLRRRCPRRHRRRRHRRCRRRHPRRRCPRRHPRCRRLRHRLSCRLPRHRRLRLRKPAARTRTRRARRGARVSSPGTPLDANGTSSSPQSARRAATARQAAVRLPHRRRRQKTPTVLTKTPVARHGAPRSSPGTPLDANGMSSSSQSAKRAATASLQGPAVADSSLSVEPLAAMVCQKENVRGVLSI